MTRALPLEKPLLRGHLHQAAFFVALGAGPMLLVQTRTEQAFALAMVYVFGLIFIFGVSALYHRPAWSQAGRQVMRRVDHSAIFVMIAASCTPICLLGLGGSSGQSLLRVVLVACAVGVLQSLFWSGAPKWLVAMFCVGVGALSTAYLGELRLALGGLSFGLFCAGGLIYSAGALVYALKRPNPWPRIFGYHEIFHLFVMIAAAMHFVVIYRILI